VTVHRTKDLYYAISALDWKYSEKELVALRLKNHEQELTEQMDQLTQMIVRSSPGGPSALSTVKND
jgi:hypothetical protein